MKILEAIHTRRSIRQFTGQVIDGEQLASILKAGFQAPSAHNRQPWEYIVIKEKEAINEIATFHPYAKMLPQAGCAIVVCGNKEKQSEEGFLLLDCAASIQNMLLAAHGLGLGAVWCGLHPIPELVGPITKLLELPDHVIPVSMIVVGNTDKQAKELERYDEDCIRFEKW